VTTIAFSQSLSLAFGAAPLCQFSCQMPSRILVQRLFQACADGMARVATQPKITELSNQEFEQPYKAEA
tara:strand:+ start:79 stop:285 length:207 start_codon:yes stop_codon:yes gene_type:complete